MYKYWKYGGGSAGSPTVKVTYNDEAAYYYLHTSNSSYGAKYTATLTRGGSTSDWTGG